MKPIPFRYFRGFYLGVGGGCIGYCIYRGVPVWTGMAILGLLFVLILICALVGMITGVLEGPE